ncbi:hypothetical protein CBR_g16060 [Chara braunii]|uniref:Uncharacterized protein n=1 Tax=Chara braunii TaxID=69332 RepID=A0A388JT07_CHABU|nr:hypothetical protein CBR_g16060 [Chara braunii]|eukprot:GBG60938.1 hypothetical protein CBR_g16060 [Chara braunii]
MRFQFDLNGPPPECTDDVYSEPVQPVERGSGASSAGMRDEDTFGGCRLCKRNCSICGEVRELPADVLEALEQKMQQDDMEFVCSMAGYQCYDYVVDTKEKRQSSGTPVLSKRPKAEHQPPTVLKPVKVEQTQSDDRSCSGKKSVEECGSYADLQKMIEFLKKNSHRDLSVKEVVQHMGRPVVKLVAALEHLAEPDIKQMLVRILLNEV